MNKLPTKQIYLLIIIIVGIIALSIYSTYAIFTFEGSTSNIVSLYTPNSLKINESVSEYQQVTVDASSYTTTDIDIYNTHDYEVCYSVWYKLINSNNSLTKIYQITKNTASSSSTLSPISSTRISILIINDNPDPIKVNIGLASTKNEGTCSLNISKDKNIITETIDTYEDLTKIINKETAIPEKEGYLTYKNETTKVTLPKDKILISKEFTYHEEEFTLTNPETIEAKDFLKYQSTEDTSYYTCLASSSCNYLYKINKITKTEDLNKDIYELTSYDLLKGYLATTSGTKQINTNNQTNYIYYGDNPHNYIYYNCTNEEDKNTCELWRIIGTTLDKNTGKYLTKIIKDTSIPSSTYDSLSNKWSTSTINKYLNEEYKINSIRFLEEPTINQEMIKGNILTLDKITYLDTNEKAKVFLMNLSDYILSSSCTTELTSSCLNNNWLNSGEKTMTMTGVTIESTITSEEPTTEDDLTTSENTTITNNQIVAVSASIESLPVDTTLSIRPVIYLKSRTLVVSGTGSLEDPYIIK